MVKLRRTKQAGSFARIQTTRNLYEIFVGKPESMKTPQGSKCIWKNNIKIYF